ncbi:MAG: alpha/beta hydrolase [Candidatus Izemoplasmatales bacterium]|nr:alpha/beta hydrolase [Candidatus Izemoplasmatales bacterium]
MFQKIVVHDDANNPIHLYVFVPEGKPKAVVHLIHGAAEHLSRYTEFATFLTQHSFVVIGCDLLGHGLSSPTSDYVHFADRNGDTLAFQSLILVQNYIREHYSKLKVYVLGHSMGSYLTEKLLIDNPGFYQKAVLSGSSYFPVMLTRFGIILASIIICFKGPRFVSKLLQNMAIDSFPKKMRKDKIISGTDSEWLTKDHQIQEYYHSSPMCGQPFTASANRDLFRWLNYINHTKIRSKAVRDLPILLASGEVDAASNYAQGVRKLYHTYQKLGFSNVQLKLYPNDRHEILNEVDRETVYQDMLNFFDQ